jgi:3-oxoacyl-[acyl-carrier-protein] synthase-1
MVCGTTAWNGLGFTPHQIWAFRRAEIAAHAETPFRLTEGQRATMLHIRTLPPRSQGVDRLAPVLRKLVAPLLARVTTLGRPRVAVVLALAERFAETGRCHGAVRRLEEAIASEAKSAGADVSLQIEPRGHAGLAFALPAVGAALASGRLDAALVGGVDTYYEAEAMDELSAQHRIFDGKNLEGFIPGEGGAFLLLARGDVARKAGWPAVARLEAAAVAEEPAALDLELPITACALTAALRSLCDPLEAARRTVDYWLCDLTHEPDRVREWMLTFARATAGVSAPEATAELLSPFLGDLGAATLPTALAIAAEGFTRGDPAGRTCIACASSPGPARGAVLISKGS